MSEFDVIIVRCIVRSKLLGSSLKMKENKLLSLFPYDYPYNEQVEYMKDVKNILEGGGIAILEAPTGFGKTAALLATTLQYEKQVIYTSRTHTQMRQVALEIERINKRKNKNFSFVVKGARSRLCLNPVVRKISDPEEALHACLASIRNLEDAELGGGDYIKQIYQHVPQASGEWVCQAGLKRIKVPVDVPSDVPRLATVERLKEYGEKRNICPYFLSKILAAEVNVIVCSYQYVLNPTIRGLLSWSLQDTFLIFDEAHNIEDICTEVLSKALSQATLEKALQEVLTVTGTHELERMLYEINDVFEIIDLPVEEPVKGTKFMEKLAEVGMDENWINRFLAQIPTVLKIQRELAEKGKLGRLYLPRIFSFYTTLSNYDPKSFVAIYHSYGTGEKRRWTVTYKCLDSSLAFSQIIDQPYAIILTSGTLSPLEGLEERLGIKAKIKKSYSPTISKGNILAMILTRGIHGKPLTTKYEARDEETALEYGETVAKILPYIPNGTILFFPSYEVQKNMLTTWHKHGILEKFNAPIFIEEEKLDIEILEDYRKAARKGKAVLAAVCRGKMSEGQNFSDEEGRAAIMIGIPFANIKDSYVKAKIEYYEEKERGKGRRWYLDDAVRTVNQAIGRVWRHKNDYAVAILMDNRYARPYVLTRITSWLRARITRPYSNIPITTVQWYLQKFYGEMQQIIR